MTNINPETGEVRLDEHGREIPDPNPMEIPLGMKRPETLAEQVQRLVRTSISAYAAQNGQETFEEADDLDLDDDDFDPSTPYELEFDPVIGREISPADFQDEKKRQWLRDQYLLAERNAARAEERQEVIQEAYQRAKKARTAPTATPAGPPAAAPSSNQGE